MEVGKRLGLAIRGVGLPGHFVVCVDDPSGRIHFDPFNGGRVLSVEDCHEIALRSAAGGTTVFAHYLEPVCSRVILSRMLSNLKLIYFGGEDSSRTVRVLDRIIQLNPGTANEYRERGLLHLRHNRLHAALTDLVTYLSHAPGCPDSEAIHRQIEYISALLHRWN
jgi:regulator of sirC expression with transglutaminase-like and TPR domain